jgi:hypothetical protein
MIGRWRMRRPVAWKTALAMVGAAQRADELVAALQ